MRFSSLFGPTAAEFAAIILACHVPSVRSVNFTAVPSPNLDLSQLGRVALTGDFDAISLYSFVGQNENPFTTNGSQSLLTQMPNGAFATLVSSDASIVAMCPFIRKDGTMSGVILGGNFTSLGGIEAQGTAMWDPTTNTVVPLPGLSGSVNALLCDQDTDTVYVGGDFHGENSTNALAWVGAAGWTNLPFAGFNGPVTSIAKSSDGNIIFGGSFTGLGNTTTPTAKDQQVVNLSTANITSGASTSTAGFSDPRNIICKTSGQDGAGNTWLLEDDTPGFWQANMNFGYQPTKLRLWNTHQDGRGTKTFRLTFLPDNGIMNMTFTDPATGQNETCTNECPLSSNSSVGFQDFHFVNLVGMNGFRIDISDWFGDGGGLDGIEMFQDDIYAFAVPSLNEPACADISFPSNATSTGPWVVTPSGLSGAEYLTADLTGPNVNSGSAQVVFMPDIKQTGNYTVTIYTPGCQQDNTCSSRGISNVVGQFAAGQPSTEMQIFQTNDFDKYDQIFHGLVDANSDSFRPTITISPLQNQNQSITLVALRVRFQLLDTSSSGLNGLFEYDPNQAVVTLDFTTSKVDVAGTSLDPGASVDSLAVVGNTTYIAGNFSGNGFENIFAITDDGNTTSLPNDGLNDAVATTFLFGNLLFVGGNFTNTATSSITGLSRVGAFDTSSNTWHTLGGGVNGPVNTIVPLSLNITQNVPETCITVSGYFSQVLASGSSEAFTVDNGFAIWVPSHNDWLQNLNVNQIAIEGQLTAATNVTGGPTLLAGTLSSQGLAVSDAVELTSSSGTASLSSIGIKIRPSPQGSSTNAKRAVGTSTVAGAVTGVFDTNNGRNNTILGGHFTTTATNGSTINDLAIVSTTSDGKQTITGIGNQTSSDSTFLALTVQSDTLYAGGTVTVAVDGANVNGLVLWNLAQGDFVSPQPPPLQGSSVVVNAIAAQPSSTAIYVAGSFDTAGSLSCPSICVFQNGQWTRPGLGLAGSISTLTWKGTDQLLVGGNMTINNNATNLAMYQVSTQAWSIPNGEIPGPVTALSPANSDTTQFWIAGKSSTNGSAYLMKYDGTTFQSTGDSLGTQTTIRGLSVLLLSQNHDNNNLVNANMALLLTGQLNLPGFGNASAALFNGTTFTPFILSNSGNNPGSLSQLVTEKQQTFSSTAGHLALGYVILIALAIAAGLVFFIVLAGFFIERHRRKKEGYRPAPQNYFEKTANMNRIPPEHLFGSLGQGGRGPTPGPHV